MRKTGLIVALGIALSFAAVRAASAEDLSIDIAGAVAKPLHLSAADLKATAPATVEVTFQTGHGEEKGSFTGAPLWTLLQSAGLTDTQGNRPDLRHAIAVIGRDGYVVILGFGEIDPDFEGKEVIISYARDGKPNDAKDGLRLIVPGDKHGGRDVRDVVKIEVR